MKKDERLIMGEVVAEVVAKKIAFWEDRYDEMAEQALGEANRALKLEEENMTLRAALDHVCREYVLRDPSALCVPNWMDFRDTILERFSKPKEERDEQD